MTVGTKIKYDREFCEYLIEQIVAHSVNEFSSTAEPTLKVIREREDFYSGGPYWKKDKHPL